MIVEYIEAHFLEWLFGIVSVFLTALYRDVSKRLKYENEKNNAIAEGVKSLLRESIVQNYNKYQDKGFCPIYAKESMKKVYEAYHNLGGNDIATKLYNTILNMDEEPPENEE